MKGRRARRGGTGDDVRAIRRLAAAWRRGWLEGDADALVALYADRPVLMPQGRSMMVGKAAIRAAYRAVFREVVIRSRSVLREVRASGDWGYFWSTYTLTARPKAGGPAIRARGKSLFVVHRKADGAWRIARLIDNSDDPG